MLCGKCNRQKFTCDIGNCKACGSGTNSGMFSLCDKCAKANNSCAACRKSLDSKPDPLERRGGIVHLKNPSLLDETAKQIVDKFTEVKVSKLKAAKLLTVHCNEPEAEEIKKLPDVETVKLDW